MITREVLRQPQHQDLAYEEYKRLTARSMIAFTHKAKELGYTWPRGEL